MALTPSTMLPIGTQAPHFQLFDTVSQQNKSLDNLKSEKATVIAFVCNHCPYVKHINAKLKEVSDKYLEQGVNFIAISSNDVENYPEDSPEKMKLLAEMEGFNFPYLYDESQAVAKAYQAACTPDFYLFNAAMKLEYRGRFCESTPGNGIAVTGKDLCEAIDAVLSGNTVNEQQYPSMGCNIKWK